MENQVPNTQSIPDQPTDTTPQPTQIISAAQLAANRFNVKKIYWLTNPARQAPLRF